MRSWLRIIGLVILGMVAGVGLGLYLGWVAWPTEFTDANPGVMQEGYQHDYVMMVATAYDLDHNLPDARKRIAGLGANGTETLLTYTINLILLPGADVTDIRRLVALSYDLGLYSPAMDLYLTDPTVEPNNGE